MPTAEVNGTTIYFEEHGSGEPLLLIMGFTGHSGGWLMQVPALAQHYRVIAFDNRGMGRSTVPPGPYSIPQMAGDAAALLDHLGIPRAHIVGWSMGGMIAQQLALNHPEKVDRLIILASLARMRDYAKAWLEATVSGFAADEDPAGRILMGMPWGFTAAFMSQPELVEAGLQAALADPYPPTSVGVAAQAAACREFLFGGMLERLADITAPTLVLVGAEDILTPVVYSREMAARIPNARLQVLDRGGHGMPIEYPQAVNEALLAFLAVREPAATPA